MSKWMGGCLLVLALFAGMTWWGYRKMAGFASGPSPSVTIGASPDRVFASLANGDSMMTWMAKGNTVTIHRHGPLVSGDTVLVATRNILGSPQTRFKWIVSEVTPGKLLVLQLRSDRTGRVLTTRRDSLISFGDSTRVVSTIEPLVMDSVGAPTRDTGAAAAPGTMPYMASKLMLSAFRMESQLELIQLKSRIEGRPAPPRR
jgi:uncharacterized protein YndB with AHSA1/START domain